MWNNAEIYAFNVALFHLVILAFSPTLDHKTIANHESLEFEKKNNPETFLSFKLDLNKKACFSFSS